MPLLPPQASRGRGRKLGHLKQAERAKSLEERFAARVAQVRTAKQPGTTQQVVTPGRPVVSPVGVNGRADGRTGPNPRGNAYGLRRRRAGTLPGRRTGQVRRAM